MRNVLNHHGRMPRPSGFTLIELLVVVTIVVLVSAITLPTVIPALTNRQVGESARILQAMLAGARDSAIRANAPRGIRIIPDNTIPGALTANRILAIEPAPDLSDGQVTFVPESFNPITPAVWATGNPPPYPFPILGTAEVYPKPSPAYAYPYYFSPTPQDPLPVRRVLIIMQAMFQNNQAPFYNSPTNWFWNVRVGDKFRFGDSGRYYTVVGPMTVYNPELHVNDGPPEFSPYNPDGSAAHSSLAVTYPLPGGGTTTKHPEFLFLVNGVDDDTDGYVDNGFDGFNQNLDFVLNGGSGRPANDDLNEWTETEQWLGAQALQSRGAKPVLSYVITRRPVPVPGAKEVSLPSGAVIDMTTWDSTRERSRLPVDALNGYVDILVNPSGQVVPFTEFSSLTSSSMNDAFFQFWIADRTDVYAPDFTKSPRLPITYPPGGTAYNGVSNYLKKDRQLLTLFTRTGQIVTNSVENFDFANAYTTNYDPNHPFLEAQNGMREAK
ncbi:MAG: hypothetical protein NVSMB9_27870 [Isosphaeraceae bacterium]